jgi:lysophospholipase L1-like esterase/sugar lactone lactonase YvrE
VCAESFRPRTAVDNPPTASGVARTRRRTIGRALLAPLVLAAFLLAPAGSASASITFDLQWGSAGIGNGQFALPQRVAADPGGQAYVTDTGNNRIQEFSSSGAFGIKWGSTLPPLGGSTDGQFLSPEGIAMDSYGDIVYVVDTNNSRIQKFSSAGTFLAKWGSSGSGNGQFVSPQGIATDSSDNVYVADAGNNRIQKFDSSGTFITKWGSAGTADGQFSLPSGVATDPFGNVYVADAGNNRIQKFDSSGTFITKWGSAGTGNGQFGASTTLDVATGFNGNVIVADTGNNRIQKFRPSGTFITTWGSLGTGTSQFNGPSGVAVDPSDHVYVVDRGNNRIQKFHESDTTPPETQIDSGPSGLTNDASPSFTFSSTEPSLLSPGFECRLDSADWASCASPKTYSSLSDGSHTFDVRAVDAAGNPDPSPVSRSFTVDTIAPETTINSGPSGLTNDDSPSFAFSSEPGASFECRLDSNQEADFDTCGSPQPYSSLGQGAHTFEVRATDQANNTDQTPASRSFTVDTIAPETQIDSGPSGTTNDPTPTFTFHSSEAASFQCKINLSNYSSCSSPKTTFHLSDGSRTFYVRAIDQAGNVDMTPASSSFTVRTAAVHVSGSTLVVTAAAGAKDNLTITRPSASVLRVTDLASSPYTGSGVHAWAGCTRSGDYTANCSAAGITLIQVSSGVQLDQVVNSTTLASSLNGGAANDVLTGGSANDTLTGGTGADIMKGMNGNDQLFARDLASDTTIDCDGGTIPGSADTATLDPLPKDPDSAVIGCETKTRGNPYVALGDSLSRGLYASSPANSFVGLLYSSYQASLGASELFNEGESGATSSSLRNNGQLSAGLADVNAGSDTKAVTIEVGANDAFFGPCADQWAQPSVCPFRANFRDILTRLKTALQTDPGTEKFTTMAYYNPPSATIGGSRADRDRNLLGTNLKIGCTDTGSQLGLNDVIIQEAGRLGIPVADTYPAFKLHGSEYISSSDPWRLHPNDAGYAAIAQAFQNATVRCGP